MPTGKGHAALTLNGVIAVGTWRSLVAHHTGGVGVAGSNPVVPTNDFNDLAASRLPDKGPKYLWWCAGGAVF
jgi:hypothetical protein